MACLWHWSSARPRSQGTLDNLGCQTAWRFVWLDRRMCAWILHPRHAWGLFLKFSTNTNNNKELCRLMINGKEIPMQNLNDMKASYGGYSSPFWILYIFRNKNYLFVILIIILSRAVKRRLQTAPPPHHHHHPSLDLTPIIIIIITRFSWSFISFKKWEQLKKRQKYRWEIKLILNLKSGLELPMRTIRSHVQLWRTL